MRRFPRPWTIDEANDACCVVRDSTGQALVRQAAGATVAADGIQVSPRAVNRSLMTRSGRRSLPRELFITELHRHPVEEIGVPKALGTELTVLCAA